MKARREFLRAASFLPLAILPTIAEGTGAAIGMQDQQLDPLAALPVSAHPQELAFTNYQLMGTPDVSTNLLGPNRPKTLSETKTALRQVLHDTVVPGDPILDWFATFSTTFDDLVSSILLQVVPLLARPTRPNELRYEPAVYDNCLRSASMQLDRCLRYRTEMSSYESAGVDAAISYLTFLKLRPIQRNLILQTSVADLQQLEKAAEMRMSQIYGSAHGFPGFEKYHLMGLHAEADAGAKEADLASSKDSLRTSLMIKQLNLQSDAQLAEFTRVLSQGSSSNYAERYLRLQAMLSEDLTDVYCKLFAAAKGVQQIVGLVNLTVGTGIPFPVDMPTFNSLATLQAWVQQVAPAQPGLARKPDTLDALVLWCRAAMRELDRASQYETEFSVTIPLAQPASKRGAPLLAAADIATAFAPPNPSGKLTFTLDVGCLPFAMVPANLRVTGIGISVEHSIDDASPLNYASDFPASTQPPPVAANGTATTPTASTSAQVGSAQSYATLKMARLNASVTTPPQGAPILPVYQRATVYLANIRLQGGMSGDLEASLSYDPACRNISPFGSWTIQFDPTAIEYFASVGALGNTWVRGVNLHLQVRGTAV